MTVCQTVSIPEPSSELTESTRGDQFVDWGRNNPRAQPVLARRPIGRIFHAAIRLVDDQCIGQFEDALLDALQLVARTRLHQHEKEIDHPMNRDFGLADPDRFDDHDVVARRFAQQHRFSRALRDTAERTAGRRGADESLILLSETLHPRLVTQDAAACDWTARVDGEHRDLVAALEQKHPKALDERTLADSGWTRDPDPDRVAGVGHQRFEYLLTSGRLIGPLAFEQRNGLRQEPAIALANPGRSLGSGSVGVACHFSRSRITPSTSLHAPGIAVPGPKIASTPASRRKS